MAPRMGKCLRLMQSCIGPSSQLPIYDGQMDFLWVSVSLCLWICRWSMGGSVAYGLRTGICVLWPTLGKKCRYVNPNLASGPYPGHSTNSGRPLIEVINLQCSVMDVHIKYWRSADHSRADLSIIIGGWFSSNGLFLTGAVLTCFDAPGDEPQPLCMGLLVSLNRNRPDEIIDIN
ncbi:hypothetical protein PCH_Pc13g09420 [Penicillium rubens Wisconsin 54-1255]|uniref:Uncharacterized protein n=1 Tax=Penicillium rubens (strain ATCC 28089 / DSM 1075 / NRRL 1951 / Wisconsin 54-1255) TaxID=500485 RepID=B6H424_PENRW|nr:hypothetical protein PCH_Pc13g09420 [Penicillium rubens Wisconsin 54-1255]